MTKKKNVSTLIKSCIGICIVVLIVLLCMMMTMIAELQGNARVINYAGLVRGKTQRIVKLEMAGEQEDKLLAQVDSYIFGLRNGDSSLQIVKIEDDAFQKKMEELDQDFEYLKKEIDSVRTYGYQNTDIIPVSEHFFTICDEAVSLAENYSEERESALFCVEKFTICALVILVISGIIEVIQAEKKVRKNTKAMFDPLTSLPGNEACEEFLRKKDAVEEDVGVCSFDLNHVRRINRCFGEDAGNQYILFFGHLLKSTFPSKCFVGRIGGDEFLVITHFMDQAAIKQCIESVRKEVEKKKEIYLDASISFAYGYALASQYTGSSLRELLNLADKNMYINKNRTKLEEVSKEKHKDYQLLQIVNQYGNTYSDCLYCNSKLNFYRKIRSSNALLLDSSGKYTTAIEQIAFILKQEEQTYTFNDALSIDHLKKKLKKKDDCVDVQFHLKQSDEDRWLKVIPVDWDENGELYHFIIAFEAIQSNTDPKEQLTLYYEQLKQDIIENDSYVDALLEMADTIYTINLTKNIIEKNITVNTSKENHKNLFMDYPLPCSYTDYCSEYVKNVTKDTLAAYRMTASPKKLLNWYETGEKHLSVEFCVQEKDNICWIQKTLLMTRTMTFNENTKKQEPIVQAIVLLKDNSHLHAREENEHARLQIAYDEMRNANRTKSEFLSRMSHDIRTPLNAIIGLLKLDEDHFDDREMLMENHAKMQISANHLLSLINDVLQVSKLEEGQFHLTHELICLEDLTRDIVFIIIERANQAGIHWEYEKEKSEIPYPYIYGSPLHLRQIFLNIYGNCIKYNKPDGSIKTIVNCLGEKDGKCTYQWIISDTGIGMSPEFLKHIFEPFSQEKQDARSVYQGTGLGMTIVKDLVEHMNGTIQVTSELGVGSKFVITIPFEIAPVPSKKKEITKNRISLEGMKILLAEDNEINADIMKALLKDQGANVTLARNGKEALDLFENGKEGQFDFILMDVMMPVMDGITSTKAIRNLERKDAKTIPIIALTANAFVEDAKQCIHAGMNAHLSKPIDMDKLLDTVSRLK